MVQTLCIALGTSLSASVLLSMVRTVFLPRERSSRAARWSIRATASVCIPIARRLPSRARRLLLDLYAPLSLLLLASVWLLGLAMAEMAFALAVYGIAEPDAISELVLWQPSRYQVPFRIGMILCVAVPAGALQMYLSGVLSAYRSREQEVARIAADLRCDQHADHLIANYIRRASSNRIESRFAECATWLTDTHNTHLAYPVLIHFRPTADVSWARAAMAMLDTAALMDAVAPSQTPHDAQTLLSDGSMCVRSLAALVGVFSSPAEVSLQDREERVFDDSVQLVVGAGLMLERDLLESWTRFQRSRMGYAHHAVAIEHRLMYSAED
jgi:hypothetical protein